MVRQAARLCCVVLAADGVVNVCVCDTFGTLLDWRTSVADQVKSGRREP